MYLPRSDRWGPCSTIPGGRRQSPFRSDIRTFVSRVGTILAVPIAVFAAAARAERFRCCVVRGSWWRIAILRRAVRVDRGGVIIWLSKIGRRRVERDRCDDDDRRRIGVVIVAVAGPGTNVRRKRHWGNQDA